MYTDDYGRSWYGPHPFTHAAVATHASNRMGVYQILEFIPIRPLVATQ
jgi:hypothetical protein